MSLLVYKALALFLWHNHHQFFTISSTMDMMVLRPSTIPESRHGSPWTGNGRGQQGNTRYLHCMDQKQESTLLSYRQRKTITPDGDVQRRTRRRIAQTRCKNSHAMRRAPLAADAAARVQHDSSKLSTLRFPAGRSWLK